MSVSTNINFDFLISRGKKKKLLQVLGFQNPRHFSRTLSPSPMAVEDENPDTSVGPKPSPSPVSQTSSSHQPPILDPDDTPPNKPLNPKEFILSVASKLSSQPLNNPDPNVWGVLTAISSNARKRRQVPLAKNPNPQIFFFSIFLKYFDFCDHVFLGCVFVIFVCQFCLHKVLSNMFFF